MNIPIKQKETHRLVISKGREMEGRTGSLALADASCYLYDRMDGQQTSPVWHKKLLCCTEEMNTASTLLQKVNF